MCKRCMSDSREGEQDDGLIWEDDKLTARCSRNSHHADEVDDDDDRVDSQQQQQLWALFGQQKGKNNKEKDKKVNSNSNRKKMQAKTKIFLLSRLGRFDEQLDSTKKKAAAVTALRSAAPFPYNGIDFGGSPPCSPCFLRPSIPPLPSSPMHKIIPAAAKTPSPANTAKPKIYSHYDFVKSLIEKNDFYSPGCNAHCDISSSHAN